MNAVSETNGFETALSGQFAVREKAKDSGGITAIDRQKHCLNPVYF